MENHKPLKNVYCLSSDETLLVQEARDQIRQDASKQGFEQYQLFCVTSSFDWAQCFDSLQNMSLFSEKQVIDLRNPTAKFEKQALALLLQYVENPNPDTILIISTNKLTAAQKRAKWYKAIEQAGEATTLWPINGANLSRWIQQRLHKHGNKADFDAIKLLAEYTEGNLLATQQAIEKLSLLYPQQELSCEQIMAVVSDNARFSVFDLANYCLTGNVERALHVLQRLKEMAIEPTLILWSLTRETRELASIARQLQQGVSIQQALSKQWSSRKPLLQNALKRLDSDKLYQLLKLSGHTDRVIKGAAVGNIWNQLAEIVTTLCGKPLFNGMKKL